MIHPTPKSFEQPAHKLSGQIIKYLIENWGRRDVLYSVNIPMIHNLLDDEGIKIYWTSFWRNNYGSLFTEASIREVEEDVFQGTDAEMKALKVVEGGAEQHKLLFKFSPKLEGILTAQNAAPGTDGWAISKNAVSVTAFQPCFSEMPVEEFQTVEERIWKMKL
jgi:broad specificity polyphosphatase/5'/3'-nucleotidase SurE